MSADESFFARWSRRKRAAATNRRDRSPPETAQHGAEPPQTAAALPEEAGPFVDPASLPPIGSIDAGSDITAFLVPGVPAHLTRAALRRAWSADPAIRDFIGLSENSWDFTAPGGVPGFGSVTAEEVERLLAQLAGEPSAADAEPFSERLPDGQSEAAKREITPASDGVALKGGEDRQAADTDQSAPQHGEDITDIAAQHEFATREYTPLLSRRRHGGALPK